jgi:ferric-dicitrate binding protein FerR (iron transport regulator)
MGSLRRRVRRHERRVGLPRHVGPILLWVTLLPLPAVAAEGVAGRWLEVQGRVSVATVGADLPRLAHEGDVIAVGELLEVAAGARAQALLADDTVVSLSPGTAIRILQYAFDPAGGRRTAVVKVIAGAARFIVAARKNSRFNVESPQATIAIPAADLVTLVSPAETTVVVLDGSARVKNISSLIVAGVELLANQSTGVRPNAAPSHPAQITPQQRKDYRRDGRSSH